MKKRGLHFTEDPNALILRAFGTTSVKGGPVAQSWP